MKRFSYDITRPESNLKAYQPFKDKEGINENIRNRIFYRIDKAKDRLDEHHEVFTSATLYDTVFQHGELTLPEVPHAINALRPDKEMSYARFENS